MNYLDLKKGMEIPETGRTIKEIIAADQTYIVYVDDSDIICWLTGKNHKEFGKDFGSVQNKISFWESTCNRLFKSKEAFDYKCLLAEGYARMLDSGNDEEANKIIKNTVDRIKLQGKQILRQDYLVASLAATAIVSTLLVCFVLTKNYLLSVIDNNIYEIFLAGFFGGIGSFISCMIKTRNYDPEISISRQIHKIDGILRIAYGLVAGVIVSLGIKANIILGFVDSVEKNIYILCFLGAISGASEWFLPNLIKEFETDESRKIKEIKKQ